jgi:hypothetical protein
MGEPAPTVTQPLKIRLRMSSKGPEDQLPSSKFHALEENDGNEGDPTTQESGSTKRLARKNKPTQIPLGGLLGTICVPGKPVPTMEELRIEQYSNTMYWRFAPYLELVCCETGSLIC